MRFLIIILALLLFMGCTAKVSFTPGSSTASQASGNTSNSLEPPFFGDQNPPSSTPSPQQPVLGDGLGCGSNSPSEDSTPLVTISGFFGRSVPIISGDIDGAKYIC